MIKTVVMYGIPTNATADQTTGPHGSGETTSSVMTVANTGY